MNIIIHGFDMPETCCKCKMMVYGSEKVWDNNGTETVGAWVCLLTGELADNTKREEHCPLTELPPHGRLIDAEEEEECEWIHKRGMIYCPECAEGFDAIYKNDFKYCPNCGIHCQKNLGVDVLSEDNPWDHFAEQVD